MCVCLPHSLFFSDIRTSPSSKDTKKLFVPPFFFDLTAFFIYLRKPKWVGGPHCSKCESEERDVGVCIECPFGYSKALSIEKNKRKRQEMEMDVE